MARLYNPSIPQLIKDWWVILIFVIWNSRHGGITLRICQDVKITDTCGWLAKYFCYHLRGKLFLVGCLILLCILSIWFKVSKLTHLQFSLDLIRKRILKFTKIRTFSASRVSNRRLFTDNKVIMADHILSSECRSWKHQTYVWPMSFPGKFIHTISVLEYGISLNSPKSWLWCSQVEHFVIMTSHNGDLEAWC